MEPKSYLSVKAGLANSDPAALYILCAHLYTSCEGIEIYRGSDITTFMGSAKVLNELVDKLSWSFEKDELNQAKINVLERLVRRNRDPQLIIRDACKHISRGEKWDVKTFIDNILEVQTHNVECFINKYFNKNNIHASEYVITEFLPEGKRNKVNVTTPYEGGNSLEIDVATGNNIALVAYDLSCLKNNEADLAFLMAYFERHMPLKVELMRRYGNRLLCFWGETPNVITETIANSVNYLTELSEHSVESIKGRALANVMNLRSEKRVAVNTARKILLPETIEFPKVGAISEVLMSDVKDTLKDILQGEPTVVVGKPQI